MINLSIMAPPAATPFADIERMVGYRHQVKDLAFFPRISARSSLTGHHLSRTRGRGMDFDEVRPYQAGDDIRSIDWRITARTTVPHTKLYREERERPILIICDLRSGMFFGSQGMKSVTACDLAAVLAWAGLAANDRVGGMVFSPGGQTDIRSKRSHHNVLRLIHSLEQASQSLQSRSGESASLAEITLDIRRVVTPGSSVFLISDFHDIDAACETQLFHISRHCDVTLLNVYDQLETQLPPPGHYRIFDGTQHRQLNTGDAKFRVSFEQRHRKQHQHLKQTAERLRLPLLEFKTGQSIMPLLRQAFGQKTSTSRKGRRGR